MNNHPMHDLDNLDVATIKIENNHFGPSKISVKNGGVIKIVNLDDLNHSLTSEKEEFDVELGAGEEIEFYPPPKGNYLYHCKYHPEMTGEIVVN